MYARVLGLAALAALTAACSSPAVRPSDDRLARPAGTARSGGYYLDDGPGARPPADPASIPDAVPRREPLLERANRPYTALGRQYVPMTRLEPFRQRGVGSWYGRRYHGQRTSSGEVYDMHAMTAAHPTLPIPSYARVTNVGNGRSTVVRINDRGPFLHDRIIDLSYLGAAKLGYIGAGSAELDVELITRFDDVDARSSPAGDARRGAATDNPPPAAQVAAPGPEPLRTAAATPLAVATEPDAGAVAGEAAGTGGGVWLQLGAFASRANAEAQRARLARQLDWPAERIEVRADAGVFKLHAGPYPARDDALAAAERVRQATGSRPFAVSR